MTLTPNMGLNTWESSTDNFNHTELKNNFDAIDDHDHTSGNGVQIPTAGIANNAVTTAKIADNQITNAKMADNAINTVEIVDGAITAPKINSAVAEDLGLTVGSTVRRGKSIITGEGTRTSATYGDLSGTAPGPDQVSNITLETDGLIFVSFYALIKAGIGASSYKATIFLDSTQLKIAEGDTVPTVVEYTDSNTGGFFVPIFSTPVGLSVADNAGTADSTTVTTGQIVGGRAWNASTIDGGYVAIFASAAGGPYDVSIKFAGDGTNAVTVKDRKLWVWTMGF